MAEHVMLVVSVPKEHADSLRAALGNVGAGTLGNYSHCSFTYEGTGRFVAGEKAEPTYGSVGTPSEVKEVRIEMLCERRQIPDIIKTLRENHPYEEPAFHYFPVEIA